LRKGEAVEGVGGKEAIKKKLGYPTGKEGSRYHLRLK